MYRNFSQFLDKQGKSNTKRMAVVWAGERHTLEAVSTAYENFGVEPVLIGNTADILRIKQELGIAYNFTVVESSSPEDAIAQAIEMVKRGEVDILFKGLLQTATIMRAIVNKDTGICDSGVLSHASLLEIPGYHKLIALTDSALLTYPSLEKKVALIKNAICLLHAVGVEEPKIAILAAVENVNPKMPETVEAAEIKEMWRRGELPGCIVEGPISYDLAMDPEAAQTKGYSSPVAGDADMLVVPNIQAGNMLVKSLIYSAHAKSVGLIIGAQVPIIITSRSAPVANKSLAVAVAAALGKIV